MGDDNYDVFVSYARADHRHAADIDSALRAGGLNTFFDRRNLDPGLRWVPALEKAIESTKAVIVLIGPRGFGNTQQYERELAFFRQTREPTFPIVPVILPGTKIADIPFNFLLLDTWIEFSDVDNVSDAPEELARLVTAARGEETPGDKARQAICPYRGLDAFREEDSSFFFGRGKADDPGSPIGQLISKVCDHSFAMVVGNSGSGKSSLVFAGLLPALRRDRARFWNVKSLRPGREPLRALAEAFNPRSDEMGEAAYDRKIIEEVTALESGDPKILGRMIDRALERAEGKPDRFLLYVDQWEELYTLRSSQDAAAVDRTEAEEQVSTEQASHDRDVHRFIELLLNAARSDHVRIVGSMRADFYGPAIAHEELSKVLPSQQVTLGPMGRENLERTIVEPARMVGLKFDPPSLVQRILDDAGADEDMLPLLQFALKETFKLKTGNRITDDAYTRAGGVRGAIRITADDAFKALSPADQQAARRLFLRLVTPGEGQEDTRARAAMPTDAALRNIVDQFANPKTRLLVTARDRADRPTVEVSHEALIRTWPLLRGWIDANRDKLRSRAAILQDKQEWEQQGSREDLLLQAGFQLERARALVRDPGDLAIDDIQDFIARSIARDGKTRSRERLVRSLIYVLLVGIIAGLVGWINQAYVEEQFYWYSTMQPSVLSRADEKDKAAKPGPESHFKECANGCPTMIVVKPGKFWRGEGDERKEVTIAKPFAVGKFEVTFAEWDICVKAGACGKVEARRGPGDKPVINVDWDDAKTYVAWLGRITGKDYRLLTEAEWEYAARAGSEKKYAWGDDLRRDGKVMANCRNCGSDWDGQTAPVGTFPANAFGLHDMHGNVAERVEDPWHDNYQDAPADGSAWRKDGNVARSVVRGGSWNGDSKFLPSAARDWVSPLFRGPNLGFRVRRTLTPP